MAVSASSGGRSVTYGTVLAKEPTQLQIPVRELDGLEVLTCGFYQSSIDCEHGGVYGHAGFGSRVALTLKWKGRTISIDSIELLAAWVRTFSADDAKQILEANLGLGGLDRDGDDEDVEPGSRAPRDRGDEEELDDDEEIDPDAEED